jgi:hypothetical protein
LKILLISYWFPPAGVIGAKRWGEFYNLSKDDDDIEITILTANWQGKYLSDNDICYIGDEVTSRPFYSINRPIGYIDMLKHPSLMIRSLDGSIGTSWHKESKKWIDECRGSEYDLVISSFGPISSVLLGNYAKKAFKVPHIVDLRDLISIQGQKSRFPLIHFLDKQIDRFITRDVDSFLVVSDKGNQKSSKFYNKKVTTIYNGLSSKISEKEVDLSIKDVTNINILYMGTLGINRNPSNILILLNEYVKSHKKINVSVNFASQDDPFYFIEEENLEYIDVNWLGYLGSGELEIEKDKSNIFLLLEDLTPNGNENLTGKIFEYLHSKKPIMVSCHKDSDIVSLLKITNAGNLLQKVEDFDSFLSEKRYLDIEKCNSFSRKNQYTLLKKIVGMYNV